jgi:predicted nucleic acid-binding protein
LSGGFVVDNSVAVRWFIPEQTTTYSESVLQRIKAGEIPHIPALWHSEFCNVISKVAKQGGLDRDKADGIITRAAMLHMREGSSPALSTLYRIANEGNLSAYDATYLELSMRLSLPLATEDDDLKKAAQKLGLLLP